MNKLNFSQYNYLFSVRTLGLRFIFWGLFLVLLWMTPHGVQGQNFFDKNYLTARAITLADFKADEKIVPPEIKYSLPGEREVSENLLDRTKRIVSIVNPKFAPVGIEAIFSAPAYTIYDGNQKYSVVSFKRGVGDILKDNSIILAKEDEVDPPLSSEPKDFIKITRVSVAEIENFETLPYQNKKIEDPTLDRGLTKVVQDGKEGKRRLLYLVRRENGVEIERKLIKNEIVVAPQDQITKIGTKIVVLSSVSGEASWTKGATAMRDYKKGTLIRVTNRANRKSVETRVGGWGPQPFTGRILDLNQDSFSKIADLGVGTIDVLVEELKE